ncbi:MULTISPECIES: outer-membrane lipoprotein carrier protein LolA [Streptomyces]|uniref:Outer-membrane lipoprotein carrier protein LolA n=1 Tax=Streptomyces koelreuteriae TaxID=2838015 RepID=A0ABX8FRK9_9ACTN|nr:MULTISPECIES: outer-membrane lipoprotein carrier protein LolA [Streptomyces]QWB23733.1 outer-membrane lipoprotein carrier protein LolA [Streptomyces koelreuteriae]UUA06705.1 outer-membrane lipoprotein carrier protein LolA [Streptomyces koelreuteriae]UUA14334.1 outer-membrane lipoprotein carrier protein LolA [Streptomyces sp. CRCS-T-1]
MAPYASDDSTTAGEVDERRSGRRKAARYVVPVTVMGVAAATIGLVPALADSGDPDLPKITAQQLIEKIAKSDVQQLSGTVKISTDLGLPDLGGLESSLMSGAAGRGEGGSSADPTAKLTELASGTHTLRVAADGPDKQKLSLLENAAEYSIVHNGKDVWAYDSKSNEVHHGTASESGEDHRQQPPATPKDFAEEALKAADDTTSVTVDGTAQVAGRDAYKLLIKPKQSGSTVGAITVAVDAKTGTPLKFTLTPASGGSAVVDAGFTQVDFAKPAASTFDFTPPKGAKVTEEEAPEKGSEKGLEKGFGKDLGKDFDKGDAPRHAPKSEEDLGQGLDGMKTIGEGWNAIATFDTGGEGVPSGKAGGDLGGFMDSLGDKVTGKFGSGTVFSTRLVNALITDDGKVYVGLVTKDALVKAADAGK